MVKTRTAADLADELDTIAAFVSGVTVTGGEPTIQLDFLIDLFTEVHDRNPSLTTFADSNGYLDRSGWDRLSPSMDAAMIDLKAIGNSTHRQITGVDNDLVLESISHLASIDKLYEVRHLLIEGLTDTRDEIEGMASFLISIDPNIRLRLMAYRHHGVRPVGKTWPETSMESMESFEERLRDRGLTNIVASVPIL